MVRKIPIQLLPRLARSDRQHQISSAHKAPFPRLPHAAKHLFPVPARLDRINPHLERPQLLRHPPRNLPVIARNRRDQRPIRHIHLRNQFLNVIHHHNRINRPKRFAVIQPAILRNIQQRRRPHVRRRVLVRKNHALLHSALKQADRALPQRLHVEYPQLFHFLAVDQRPEIQFWQRVRLFLHHHRIPITQSPQQGEIHLQKLRKQFPLYHVSHVRRAPLLPVIKSLLQLLPQPGPIRKLPHSVGVHSLHLQYVSLVFVIQGRSDHAAVRLPSHKRQAIHKFIPHQRFAQLPARPAHQRYWQSALPGHGMRQRQCVQPAVRRRLRNRRIPRQRLNQYRVHQHRHRIIPRRDIRNQPQRRAFPQHALDVRHVPFHPTDAPLNIRQRLRVRLPDLPHQQQRNQLLLLRQPRQAIVHPPPPLVEVRVRPARRLGLRKLHRRSRGFQINHRDPPQAPPINRRFVVPPESRVLPLPFHQIENAPLGIKRFRRFGLSACEQTSPFSNRRNNRHARPLSPNQVP